MNLKSLGKPVLEPLTRIEKKWLVIVPLLVVGYTVLMFLLDGLFFGPTIP